MRNGFIPAGKQAQKDLEESNEEVKAVLKILKETFKMFDNPVLNEKGTREQPYIIIVNQWIYDKAKKEILDENDMWFSTYGWCKMEVLKNEKEKAK